MTLNIQRQFKRVRQQADQLFLKTDKTDVVGELHTAEKQVEDIKLLCESYTRGLEKCMQTYQLSEEKYQKKIPEYLLADIIRESLIVSKDSLQDDPDYSTKLLKVLLDLVVDAESAIGQDLVLYEENVAKEVLSKFHTLLKDDFPLIAKEKKHLKQIGLDLDAAKTKWRSALANPGPNSKVEIYKEEMDDALLRLDQTKDSYASDIFSMLAREREMAQLVVAHAEFQREFLYQALLKMDYYLPKMKNHLEFLPYGPVFGVTLSKHLKIAHQSIAVPIRICVRRLIEVGLYEEGLLRVPGSTSKIRRMRSAFDAGLVSEETLALVTESDRDYDVHVIAGALKCYLRDLPEPLLAYHLHDQWLEAVRVTEHKERLEKMWAVVEQLPSPNRQNLCYVIKFLSLLAEYSDYNKMKPASIAIVMTPNLLWDLRTIHNGELDDVTALGRSVTLGNDYRNIVEILIEYANYFFKEETDFGVLPRHPPVVPPSPIVQRAQFPVDMTMNVPGHRRGGSNDLNLMPESVYPECESPKHPVRTRKKQAPLPPQALQQRDHGYINSIDLQSLDDITFARGGMRSSFTQEYVIGKDGAGKLHHTNSIRRPTTEPPKPPVTSTPVPQIKPPRPSPPEKNYLDVDSNQTPLMTKSLDKIESSNVIGFESMEVERRRHSSDNIDVIPCELQNLDTSSPQNVGFIVSIDTKDKMLSSKPHDIRKSLENILQQQAAGQPVALPRHAALSSSSDETNKEHVTVTRHLVLPTQLPVPAQRTLKEVQTNVMETNSVDNSRPQVPDKPMIVANKLPLDEVRFRQIEESTFQKKESHSEDTVVLEVMDSQPLTVESDSVHQKKSNFSAELCLNVSESLNEVFVEKREKPPKPDKPAILSRPHSHSAESEQSQNEGLRKSVNPKFMWPPPETDSTGDNEQVSSSQL